MIKCGEAVMKMAIRHGYAAGVNNSDRVVKEVSTLLGMSVQQVERLINTNGFSAAEMEKICNFYGYTIAYIPNTMAPIV